MKNLYYYLYYRFYMTASIINAKRETKYDHILHALLMMISLQFFYIIAILLLFHLDFDAIESPKLLILFLFVAVSSYNALFLREEKRKEIISYYEKTLNEEFRIQKKKAKFFLIFYIINIFLSMLCAIIAAETK